MMVNLPSDLEVRLRMLADRQSRDIGALVEEAVHLYLEAVAITDLDSAEVSEAQITLVNEHRGISTWEGDAEKADD